MTRISFIDVFCGLKMRILLGCLLVCLVKLMPLFNEVQCGKKNMVFKYGLWVKFLHMQKIQN